MREPAPLPPSTKNPLTPPTPPPFCQLLRAHLEGARIERIEQVGNDRIVRLVMQRDGKPVTLVAELTGRTANLMLLDEAGAVRGQLRKGRFKIGDVYVAPLAKAHPVGAHGGASDPEGGWPSAPTSESFPTSAELERRYQEHDEAPRQGPRLDSPHGRTPHAAVGVEKNKQTRESGHPHPAPSLWLFYVC